MVCMRTSLLQQYQHSSATEEAPSEYCMANPLCIPFEDVFHESCSTSGAVTAVGHAPFILLQDWECPLDVPWSLRAKRPPADPRPHPEPGEVPIEAPPMALALPTFAIFPESEEKKDGGDEDSVLSWSDTPRRHDATDEATSAPCERLLSSHYAVAC